MPVSEENKQKADVLITEVSTKINRLYYDVTFLRIEADSLGQLSRNISNEILKPSNLLAEEIDRWGERGAFYHNLRIRSLDEGNIKLHLINLLIENLTFELEKLGFEIPREISNLSADIESYDFDN